jgi:hypothetical protein
LIGIFHTLGKSEMTLNHNGATINQLAIHDIIGNDGRDIISNGHKKKKKKEGGDLHVRPQSKLL